MRNSLFSMCITCNKEIQDALYNDEFFPNFLILISGFIILGLIVLALTYFTFKNYRKRAVNNTTSLNPVPLTTNSLILGIGIGGFIDGILFHQILQWHGMLSNRIPLDTVVGKSVNMFWDGIFHAFTLIAVIIGVAGLFRLLKRRNILVSPGIFWGGMLAGWGLFNFVEGLIHHLIIRLHNVNEFSLNPDYWNYGFLASGLLIMGIGYFFIKKSSEVKNA